MQPTFGEPALMRLPPVNAAATVSAYPPAISAPPRLEPPSVEAITPGSPAFAPPSVVESVPWQRPFPEYEARRESLWEHGRFFIGQVWSDHQNYYTWQHAARMSLVFGGGAVLANTRVDQEFRNFWQNEIGRVDAVHAFKYFGEGYIIVPSYVAAAGVGWLLDEYPAGSALGQWGEKSFRSTLVGFPPLLFMQFATGGSRPGERHYNSAWRPFFDNNSVSGHAFMGAIPFLTAAQMAERPLVKGGLLAASTMTGLSRINDDAHYLSQAILGWSMAAVAVSSIAETDAATNMRVSQWLTPEAHGLQVEWRR